MTMLEFEFIKKCTASLPSQAEGLLCGIGDDCAVFTGSASRDWLITTDAFSEGIHFNRDWMSAAEIGRRCLTGAVSDIAAMGGRPRYVTVAIAVPSTLPAELAAAVMAGISTEAGAHQMVVIGGDTSAAAHDLHLVLTVIGDIRHGAALYRRFAKVGDAVYVTGNLGGSLAGLRELQRVPLLCKEGPGEVETSTPPGLPLQRGGVSINRHLHPVVRIASGQWLADTGCVTAMIDLSDGLVQDLGHIAQASGGRIEINADAVPRWPAEGRPVDLQTACTSGEEYELAFTVDGRRDAAFQRLLPAARVQLGHPITRIGTVVTGQGVVVRDPTGQDLTPRQGGFEHLIGRPT